MMVSNKRKRILSSVNGVIKKDLEKLPTELLIKLENGTLTEYDKIKIRELIVGK